MAVASPIPEEPPRISAQRSRSSVIRGLHGSDRGDRPAGVSVGPSLAAAAGVQRASVQGADPWRDAGSAVAIADSCDDASATDSPAAPPPILVIELGPDRLRAADLLEPERRVRGDSKLMWGLIIVFIGLLGPILYLAVGRRGGMTERTRARSTCRGLTKRFGGPRRRPRRRRPRPRRPGRLGLRAARTQRRRQDHDPSAGHRARPPTAGSRRSTGGRSTSRDGPAPAAGSASSTRTRATTAG